MENIGNDLEWSLVENNVAWTLCTMPTAARRDPPLAMHLATTACERFSDASAFLTTLGAAQFRAEKFAESIWTLERAVELQESGAPPLGPRAKIKNPQNQVVVSHTSAPAFAYYFLGMAHEALRNKERASHYVKLGNAYCEQHAITDDELSRIRDEARRMIATEGPSNSEADKSLFEARH